MSAHAATLRGWNRFLRASAHILSRSPRLLLQEAANDSSATVRDSANRRYESGSDTRIWFRRLSPARPASACLLTIAARSEWLLEVRFSDDGRAIVAISRGRAPRR